MARLKYRKISPYIWNDRKFKALSEKAQFLVLFMLTHPNMTPLGAIRGNMPGLAYELKWETKAFSETFAEACGQGMVKYDDEGPLFWFPNFLKHNSPESPNVIRSWVGGWQELPECALKEILVEHAACTVGALSEPFKKAFSEAFNVPCRHPSLNQEQEQKQKQEQEQLKNPLSSETEVDDAPSTSEPVLPSPESAKPAIPDASETAPPNKSESKSLPTSSSPEPCPHQKIAELYNAELPQLPQVREVTKARQDRLRQAWRGNVERQSIDWWAAYFSLAARCPFLLGESKRGWKAGFDWLIKPANMVKVLEGLYLPDNPKPEATRMPEHTRHNAEQFERLMQE